MAEQTTQGFTPFKLKDKVWLDGQNLKMGYPSWKLQPKRKGPFEITEVMGHVTYHLKLLDQWRIHPIFHASLLSPYRETDAHGPNYLQPPPDLIEGEEEYKVEVIVAHRKWGKGYLYLVKWTGYPSSENTWQNADSLKGASEILEEYKNCLHLWILSHIILWSSCLTKPSHLLMPKPPPINNYDTPDSFTSYEINPSNKHYSTVSPIPLTKTLSNTHTLLGLRQVHTDAVARINFLLSMNANRLVQWNADRLFNNLYRVL